MKKCGYRAEQIEEYVRGELGEDERAELERHLAECEDCRREAEFLKTVSELTEENMAEPPKELREGVMAAVKREKRRRRFIPRAAAGVLAASLAVAVGLRWLPNGSTESSGAQPGVYVMSAGSAQDSPSGVYSIEVPEPAAAEDISPQENEPETSDGTPYTVIAPGSEPSASQTASGEESKMANSGSDGMTDTERGISGGTAVPLVYNGSLAIEPSSVKELCFTEETGETAPQETFVFAGDAEEETEYFVSLVLVPVDEYGDQDGAVTVTYAPAVTGTLETIEAPPGGASGETEPSGETEAVVTSIESTDGVTFTTVTVVFNDDSTVSFKYSEEGYIVADDVWYTFEQPERRR